MSGAADRPLACIILAAGQGTRMRDDARHKATYPVGGIPAIERAIRVYQSCGASQCLVVVGVLADQVRSAALAAGGDIRFVFQPEQRGTAHAARLAADTLQAEGFTGDVLLVAGDKVIAPTVLARLLEEFRASAADLAFVTGSVADFPTAGRVLLDTTGRPSRIVEVADIARARLLAGLAHAAANGPVPPEEARAMVARAFPEERKAAKALGDLWQRIKGARPLSAAEVPPPDQAALWAGYARSVSLSVYLFRAEALYRSLDGIGSLNAQGEEYLTDALEAITAMGRRATAVALLDATEVMAFNTPEEYQAVRRAYEGPGPLRLVSASGRLAKGGLSAVEESALRAFVARYGDHPVLLSSAPGRLNLMGRHIDHQGGTSNLIALDRRTVLAVATRDDRMVNLHNANPRFPDREFAPDRPPAGTPWVDYVNGAVVRDLASSLRGDWSLYVRAAFARLEAVAGRPLRGLNIAAAGDIPIAAGLSSSSALVVSAVQAVAALNGLDVPAERLVELCGEAEWFTGTRGGAGDHAAMLLGRAATVTQVGYFPFGVTGTAPLPDGHTFVVFNSGIPARKTAEARAVFNQRIACYNIGRELLKQWLPDAGIEHLRDVTTERLGIALPGLIRLLKRLPELMTLSEVRDTVPSDGAGACLQEPSGPYPVRGVVLFGLAECERARRCLELLRAGNVSEFGRWMRISHAGDRMDASDCSDAAMDRWIAAAEAGDPEAALERQPGAYGCSTPQIDRMVDVALSVEGVFGAQLSGAGLGGCIMILARDECLGSLESAMQAQYYEPAALAPEVIRCQAMDGSTIL